MRAPRFEDRTLRPTAGQWSHSARHAGRCRAGRHSARFPPPGTSGPGRGQAFVRVSNGPARRGRPSPAAALTSAATPRRANRGREGRRPHHARWRDAALGRVVGALPQGRFDAGAPLPARPRTAHSVHPRRANRRTERSLGRREGVRASPTVALQPDRGHSVDLVARLRALRGRNVADARPNALPAGPTELGKHVDPPRRLRTRVRLRVQTPGIIERATERRTLCSGAVAPHRPQPVGRRRSKTMQRFGPAWTKSTMPKTCGPFS